MLELADDVLRAADLGGHDGNAMGGSLDQCQAIGFHQRRIDEHAARPGGESIEFLDLPARVRLGIGDLAVEIMAVDGIDETAQHILLFRFARLQIVAQPGENYQIALLAQRRRLAEGFDEPDEVLLVDGAGDRQHHGLHRFAQERGNEFDRRRDFPARGAAVDPRDQAMDLADPGRRIGRKLPFAFVARRADDRPRTRDRPVLFRDPRLERGAGRRHRQALVHAERMRGVDEGNAQRVFDLARHIRCIGEMRMDEVGQALALPQFRNQRFGKGGAVGAQRFLRQIAPVAAVDPPYDQLGTKPFLGLGMDRPEPRIVEPPCNDFRHFHIAAPGKRFHLAQDVGDVPPRIFGDPVPDRLAFQAAAECERYDMQNRSP